MKDSSCWNFDECLVFCFNLYQDPCDGANIRMVKSIDHSFIKLNHACWDVLLLNIATDTDRVGVYVIFFN